MKFAAQKIGPRNLLSAQPFHIPTECERPGAKLQDQHDGRTPGLAYNTQEGRSIPTLGSSGMLKLRSEPIGTSGSSPLPYGDGPGVGEGAA